MPSKITASMPASRSTEAIMRGVTAVNKRETNSITERDETDCENREASDIEQDDDEDDDGPSVTKQASTSKKRKGPRLIAPVIKKQKTQPPATQRQSKPRTSRTKPTVKEQWQVKLDEDKRPLPWDKPEIWAEV